MNQRAIVFAVVAFIAIVAALFAFSYLKKQELARDAITIPKDEPRPVDEKRIIGLHVFKNGTHTVLGEVEVESTCTLLEATPEVSANGTTATLRIVSIESDDSTCELKATAARFLVSFAADEAAIINATYNGASAILNLVEGDPTKDLKLSDELFIKG
jgi:hypothetical protein